jgi:SAM-dependent methyltransferase
MKPKWATQIGRTPLGMLIDALRGEALLRVVPGRRVLDIGGGSPEIARWIEDVAESLTTIPGRELASEDGTIELHETPDDSFDVTYSVQTLARLGHDAESSDRAVRSLMTEATRVTAPGGLVIVELDNPRSLRGAAHGIRQPLRQWLRPQSHPIGAVVTGTVVIAKNGQVRRYDTISRLLEFAPRVLDIIAVHGIRVAIALPETLAIPLVGRLLTRFEWFARDSELLQRFGAHLLVIMRKRPSTLPNTLADKMRRAASSSGFKSS